MHPERDVNILNALNQTWDRLNAVAGNQLPEVEWYLTAGPDSPHAVSWDDNPVVLRMNLQERSGEVDEEGRPVFVNRKPSDILTQLVHLAAHAMTRNEPTQGAEGRYHGTHFATAADALGLSVLQPDSADYNTGTGRVPTLDQPKLVTKYAAYLRRIDAAMQTWEPERARKDSRSPQTLRCRCTVQTVLKGMEKRRIRPSSQPPTAPKVISASKGVRERGGIICADCGAEFT